MRISPLWLAICLAICVLVVSIAQAHSWYPHECCSDRDCAPLPDNQIPKPLDGGAWLLSTGEIVNRDKVKWSPDGHYHLCRFGAVVLCLFVPPQGS